MMAGDFLEVWRGGVRDSSPPRFHRCLECIPLFQTWSAFSKHGDRAAVELPCHDRTLLRARSPPTVHPDALLTLHTKLAVYDPSGPLSTEVFTISRDQVASLKQLCGHEHILRRERSHLAVHVRCAPPSTRFRSAPRVPGRPPV
jgi:hypothetical protein